MVGGMGWVPLPFPLTGMPQGQGLVRHVLQTEVSLIKFLSTFCVGAVPRCSCSLVRKAVWFCHPSAHVYHMCIVTVTCDSVRAGQICAHVLELGKEQGPAGLECQAGEASWGFGQE